MEQNNKKTPEANNKEVDNLKTEEKTMKEIIVDQLLTVYDPEFPVVDIYTLGLIREITLYEEKALVHILMTFTTPQCPMWDMIEQMTRNAILEVYPARTTDIEITFDPLWTPKMIRDEDLQRMFE